MTESDGRVAEIATSLGKVLSRHGHGFQYAVLRRAEELSRQRRSLWVFEGSEFPVTVRGASIHVDFVLRSRRTNTYLVAECKRADPAKAIWCFVRAPYTRRDSYDFEMVFDAVSYTPPDSCVSIHQWINERPGSYHLGVELKTDAPGDGISSRPAVNDAATQVLRGVSGLINHLCKSPASVFTEASVTRFLPVIFTTAELWTTETDLGAAELTSGKVTIGDATKVNWLWFTHNRSPELRQDIESDKRPREIAEALRADYARTIAIVGPDGIDEFLSAEHEV
jgi:hypothetical protein